MNKRTSPWAARLALVLVLVIALAYAATLVRIVSAKWNNLDPALIDFGKVCQVLNGPFTRGVEYPDRVYYYTWAYAPFLLGLFPFFALFRSPFLLMVFQALVFASCLPLLYLLARRYFQTLWPAIAFPLLFAMCPMVNLNATVLFSGEKLFVPLLLLTVYLLETNRTQAALLTAALSCVTKIQVLPVLLLFGFYHWRWQHHYFGRRLMKQTAFFLLAMLLGALLVYAITGKPMRFSQLHLGQATLNPLAYAQGTASQILLFVQWAFLPFLAPEVLGWGLMDFAYLIVSWPTYTQIPDVRSLLTYSSLAVPLLHPAQTSLLAIYFLAFLVGTRRLVRWLSRRFGASAPTLEKILVALLLPAGFAWYLLATPNQAGPFPLTVGGNPAFFTQTARAAEGMALVQSLPQRELGVTSTVFFERAWASAGARRIAPGISFDEHYEYGLFDLYDRSGIMTPGEYVQQIVSVLNSDIFRVVYFHNGFLLLRKGPPDQRNQEAVQWILAHQNELLASPSF